jgi:hypothetical protein
MRWTGLLKTNMAIIQNLISSNKKNMSRPLKNKCYKLQIKKWEIFYFSSLSCQFSYLSDSDILILISNTRVIMFPIYPICQLWKINLEHWKKFQKIILNRMNKCRFNKIMINVEQVN